MWDIEIVLSHIREMPPSTQLPLQNAEVACPMYTDRTCSVTDSGSESLFIAVQKPHNFVTSATISHWVRGLMSESGIDVHQF